MRRATLDVLRKAEIMSRLISAEAISVPGRLSTSSVEIPTGFSVITGPSGAGKTTFAQALLGLVYIESGSITHWSSDGETPDLTIKPPMPRGLLGRMVDWTRLEMLESKADREYAKYRAEHIGYIEQQANLPEGIPVGDFISNFRLALGDRIDVERLHRITDQLDVTPNLSKPADKQSGGQEQRLAAALAIVSRRRLLVADEPSASLDESSTRNLLELTRSLVDNEDMSVLWITHEPLPLEYADQRFDVSRQDNKVRLV